MSYKIRVTFLAWSVTPASKIFCQHHIPNLTLNKVAGARDSVEVTDWSLKATAMISRGEDYIRSVSRVDCRSLCLLYMWSIWVSSKGTGMGACTCTSVQISTYVSVYTCISLLLCVSHPAAVSLKALSRHSPAAL